MTDIHSNWSTNLTTITKIVITTSNAPLSSLPDYLLYLILMVSSFLIGINYVPVKKYETGDGMFFQLVVAIAIWTTGLFVHAFRSFPKFYALPLLGGFFWSTGNINTVPVIKCIGIGLGSLIWNSSCLLLGWANARFGWFDVGAEIPRNPSLNYIGVALAVVSTVVLIFVKPITITDEEEKREDETPLAEEDSSPIRSLRDPIKENGYFDRLGHRSKQIVGISLALFAGVMYAFTYTPPLYIQTNYVDASQNSLDYAFSLSTGILLGALFYFILYCLYKKRRPDIYAQSILPALIVGWMWGVGNNFYYISTNGLTQTITFPITNAAQSAFAALCGLFFKEIKGFRNYLALFVGTLLAIIASIFCGISQ